MKVSCHCLLLLPLLSACGLLPDRVQPIGWRSVDTTATASLRGLAAVDANVALVGGANGTLLRTDDGGETWRDVAPRDAAECDFRDLEAFDREHVLAMVAGQPARVYRTSDGGANWQVVHEDERSAAFFDAMAFHGDVGMLFGDAIDGRFQCLVTTDAGRSWRPQREALVPQPRGNEAAFAASGTCLATKPFGLHRFVIATGGDDPRLLGLTNGASPFVVELPMARGKPSRGAFSVAANERAIVVVGGDYADPERSEGTAAWSTGWEWRASNAGGYRSAVVWLDDLTLLAVGSHGASASYDAGVSWLPFGTVGYHSLVVAPDGAVWACGSDGRVGRLIIAE